MSIPTDKSIKEITYNGTVIPLAAGRKVKIGSFTASSQKGITVSHQLGEKPSVVILFTLLEGSSTTIPSSSVYWAISQDQVGRAFATVCSKSMSAAKNLSTGDIYMQDLAGAGGLSTTDGSGTASANLTHGGPYNATATTFQVARPGESFALISGATYYYIAIV